MLIYWIIQKKQINQCYTKILNKYEVRKIRIHGNEVIGPALGMIELIERVFNELPINKVADVFAGSLAYSQICCKLGAKIVDAYDLNITNYYPENSQLKTYKTDILQTKGSIFSNYDLVIVEPPRKYHLLLLNALPNHLDNAIALFRVGFTKYTDHIEDCWKICESKLKNKNWEIKFLYGEAYIKIVC